MKLTHAPAYMLTPACVASEAYLRCACQKLLPKRFFNHPQPSLQLLLGPPLGTALLKRTTGQSAAAHNAANCWHVDTGSVL